MMLIHHSDSQRREHSFRHYSFHLFTSAEECEHQISIVGKQPSPARVTPASSRGLRCLGTFRLLLCWCSPGRLLQKSPRRPVRAATGKSEQPWCDPRHTAAQISQRRPPGADEQEHRAPVRPPNWKGGRSWSDPAVGAKPMQLPNSQNTHMRRPSGYIYMNSDRSQPQKN